MNTDSFSYKVDEDFDNIFDEKGNTFLALRKVYWGNSTEPKLDLRKWYTTAKGETVGKGFSFLTEDGPNELARVLLVNNFGETEQVIESIKDRPDFKSSLVKVLGDDVKDIDIELDDDEVETYYDPKEVLL